MSSRLSLPAARAGRGGDFPGDPRFHARILDAPLVPPTDAELAEVRRKLAKYAPDDAEVLADALGIGVEET